MTNKVKPFYIRITDDMTAQMVQDAFDKCVDAGAVANESIDDTKTRHKYFIAYLPSFDYFGVNEDFETYLNNGRCNYGAKTQEITLDQLDEYLGIDGGSPKQVEWKNGDECKYLNSPVKHYFIGANPLLESHCYIVSDDGYVNYVNVGDLSKPETPEQKAERERIENGKAIYDLMSSIEMNHDIAGTPNTWAELRDERQSVYIQLAESVGYRKQ